MNFDQFNKCRDHAAVLYASQTGDLKLSFDTIFLALHLGERRAQPRTRDAQPAPTWFTETLEKMAGERTTVSHFLMMAGRFPIARRDSLDVARWLREAGKQDRKQGGKLLFDL